MEGTPDAAKIVEAAQVIERIAKSIGVTIQYYHGNNRSFYTHKFKAKVATSNQTMSFCGFDAHHQNGKAENGVKDISICTKIMLLHASHVWPNAIHSSLWPAAMKNYTNIQNSLPTNVIPSQRIRRSIVTARYN